MFSIEGSAVTEETYTIDELIKSEQRISKGSNAYARCEKRKK